MVARWLGGPLGRIKGRARADRVRAETRTPVTLTEGMPRLQRTL